MFYQIDHAVRITPFVIVPSDNLRQVIRNDHGGIRIKNTRVRVADNIRGNYRVFGVFQDTFKRALRGLFESGIYLVF